MGSERIYQVNLEELIEDYAWRCFKRDRGFFKSLFVRRSNYFFDIRWGYIDFKHETNPDKKQSDANQPPAGQSTSETVTDHAEDSAIDTALRDIQPTVDEATKKDIELYVSVYENKTTEEQKYTFSATRETTAATRIEMQENYTLGATTNLEINFAEIVKVGGELSASQSVTETKAEEFSKTLTWDINTEIVVPSWNLAKASFYVYEMPSKSNFVVKTTLRLPSGQLPVTIRKVKDGKEVHTEWICDLAVLFDENYRNRSSVAIVPEKVTMENGDEVMENHIVLTTRGVCRNVSFKNQHVRVECKKMAGAPPADSNTDKKSTHSTEEQDGVDGGEHTVSRKTMAAKLM